MEREFYLDNAATTKMSEEAIMAASGFLTDKFYNPSALYSPSVLVRKEIENARKTLFELLGGLYGNLIFTGSATEANNTVIFSCCQKMGARYLFGAGEHPSVLMCAKELKLRGFNVEFIPLDKTGKIDEEAFVKMLSDDVKFISIQHVSNETGAINDIERLVKLAKSKCKDVYFHSDGVQAFMKIKVNVDKLGVDFYTISAHKIGGAKGIGALYVRKGVKLKPLIYGGGQESGLRSGTENVFNIISFVEAAKKMKADFNQNAEKLTRMRSELLDALTSEGIDYKVHGDGVANIISIMLDPSIRGETLVHSMEARGVYISTGSACSATKNLNTTLEAMGISKAEVLSSVRISLSPYMDFDAKLLAKIFKEEIDKLKRK